MKKIYYLFLLIIITGCSKDDPKPKEEIENPRAVTLVFPYENSLCNEGTNITDSVNTVNFEWTADEFSDEYELNVKNLTTGFVHTKQTPDIEFSLVLHRATPYAWYVISKSVSIADTAHSVTWRFYNAGEAIESYAPFPAEIISPQMAETLSAPTGVVILDWNGYDIDDDIAGYDVYFGTSSPPGILVSNIAESSLNDVNVTSNTIYFWRVIVKDSAGNSSDSGIYQFKIL